MCLWVFKQEKAEYDITCVVSFLFFLYSFVWTWYNSTDVLHFHFKSQQKWSSSITGLFLVGHTQRVFSADPSYWRRTSTLNGTDLQADLYPLMAFPPSPLSFLFTYFPELNTDFKGPDLMKWIPTAEVCLGSCRSSLSHHLPLHDQSSDFL